MWKAFNLHTGAGARYLRWLQHAGLIVLLSPSLYAPPVPALDNLAAATAFIAKQTLAGNGLPKTFDVPPEVTVPDSSVVNEGVGLYDSALAIWALVENGQRQTAREILTIYTKETFGTMTLRAYPNSNNGSAFRPLNATSYLLFDFTRANGDYRGWDQYHVHGGPNAWMILAGARYIEESRKANEQDDAAIIGLIRTLGNSLIMLQSNPTVDGQDHGDSQGGVRFAPLSTSDPNGFNEVNTENNLSAYSAFLALYKITSDFRYLDAANGIIGFLRNANFYNPVSGQTQKGLSTEEGRLGMFYAHASYSAFRRRWEMVPIYAADSSGTWAISALGPDKIEELFGPYSAQSIWWNTRQNFGRIVKKNFDGSFRWTSPESRDEALSGFDFSRDYGANDSSRDNGSAHSLISPEWTAGAIFAAQQIIAHCQALAIHPYCAYGTARLQNDVASMRQFLSQYAGPYAVGPGLTSSRNGATGFGWQSPPDSVTAMSSVYAAFRNDPLAWARTD